MMITRGMDQKRICLLIDDDLDDHEIFSIALTESGFSVELRCAHDGADALTQLRTGNGDKPDFIFLDLNMPKMNGKECLCQLKNDVALRDIPVVIYSTSAEIRDMISAQQLGAFAYIVKSASIRELSMALEDFFSSV